MYHNAANRFKQKLKKKTKVKRCKCTHFTKSVFFISNSIITLSGIAFLCAAFSIISKAPHVSKTDKIHAFIGICDISLGLLGITVTFKENNLIILFVGMVLLLIPVHMGFGIEALLKIAKPDFYDKTIRRALENLLIKIEDGDIDAAYDMGIIQYHFECCGINGYEDYKEDDPYLPRSCCKLFPTYCSNKGDQFYARGCQEPVLSFTLHKRKITGISLLLMLIPLFAVGTTGTKLSVAIRKS